MATEQLTKQEAMNKLNGVIAALNNYPDLDSTNTLFSYANSTNPTDLLVDFFKTTKGYDWLVNAVSKYIGYSIPVLELAVKGVLLTNIRTMLSCSTNPLITEQMIQDGVVFNLNRVDIFNIFKYSPLNKKQNNPGKYYYFGCDPEDGVNDFTDLKFSRDFNAVLWYAKNSPGERIAWRRESDVGKPYNISKHGTGSIVTWSKQVKSNGITTIQYNGRSSGLSKADGSEMFVQEPIENCVHVFIGYCVPEKANDKTKEINECTKKISLFNDFYEKTSDYIQKIKDGKELQKKEADERGASSEELNNIELLAKQDNKTIDRILAAIDGNEPDGIPSINTAIEDILGGTSFIVQTLHETIDIPTEILGTNRIEQKAIKIVLLDEESHSIYSYPDPKSNYYYRHPLFEWNTDFVMSMNLFDEKVVTAMLIDAITGCLKNNGDISLTFQMRFMQEQLRKIIEKILETDDGVVSDCFFSFTNDSYNAMLNEVELNRANLHTLNAQTVNTIPSADDVMGALNTLSHDASKEELTSAISSSLFTAVASTLPLSNDPNYKVDFSLDFKTNTSIMDILLEMLVYAIVNVVLQPKVYILLMTNLKLLGGEPNFDIFKFIQQFGNLVIDIIKTVRDNILEYFKNEMMDILSNLTKELAVKLTLEQYQYYITLLTHCTDCLRIHRNELDWIQDDVDYADITELNQELNQEC